MGFAATGETFETASMHVFRVEDGRIHEQWQLADALGMLQQLDLLPDSPGKVARLVLGRVKGRLVGSR